jgi:hypothetical protein
MVRVFLFMPGEQVAAPVHLLHKPIRDQEQKSMRFLVKISMPVEAGNVSAKRDGFAAIQDRKGYAA